MVFAGPTDVETAYEGSLPASSEDRVQYLLDVVSARLRALLPDLEARIEVADLAADGAESDLALLAKDAVVNAVLTRLPGGTTQVQSETQSAGPWSVTKRYTVDKSGTFADEDLEILRGATLATGKRVGTIKLGLVDWSDQ